MRPAPPRLYDEIVINRLILRHNQSVAALFAVLKTNEKRKLFAMLRKLRPSNMNYLFPGALTIGEFATAAIMQSDLARRRKRQQLKNPKPSDEEEDDEAKSDELSSSSELDDAHCASDSE